jgi:hypothetical protein
MKVVKNFPPNFEEIRSLIPITDQTIYCYGDTIYNPSGQQIPEDVYWHEVAHSVNQTNPSEWWVKYLSDPIFRFNEELDAYTFQYRMIKELYSNKGVKELLNEFATNLSLRYNIPITVSQAETAIRKREKVYQIPPKLLKIIQDKSKKP